MRRPQTHRAEGHAEESRPAVGHSRFIGRVGALAVFLGVGAALGMPTAHADTDDSTSSGASSSGASSSGASSSGASSSGASSSGSTSSSESRSDSTSHSGSDSDNADSDSDGARPPRGELDEDSQPTISGAFGEDSDLVSSHVIDSTTSDDESDATTAEVIDSAAEVTASAPQATDSSAPEA
nr:hypothetical protein [Actinomycetes bacterium]